MIFRPTASRESRALDAQCVPGLVEEEDEDGTEVAEALRDGHRLVGEPHALLVTAEGAVLVDDEGLDADEVPQGALTFEHLGGLQTHLMPSVNSAWPMW